MKIAVDLQALKDRKKFLEKELKHINGLLDLYEDEDDNKKLVRKKKPSNSSLSSNNEVKKDENTDKSNFSDYVYDAIDDLKKATVSDIFARIKETYPDVTEYSHKELHNKTRTTIFNLKKRNKISAMLNDNNKNVYMIK